MQKKNNGQHLLWICFLWGKAQWQSELWELSTQRPMPLIVTVLRGMGGGGGTTTGSSGYKSLCHHYWMPVYTLLLQMVGKHPVQEATHNKCIYCCSLTTVAVRGVFRDRFVPSFNCEHRAGWSQGWMVINGQSSLHKLPHPASHPNCLGAALIRCDAQGMESEPDAPPAPAPHQPLLVGISLFSFIRRLKACFDFLNFCFAEMSGYLFFLLLGAYAQTSLNSETEK